MRDRSWPWLTGLSLGLLGWIAAGPVAATELRGGTAAPVIATSTFGAELLVGYLTGRSGEYVYDIPGRGAKLSQLNWQIDHAFTVGGRLTARPLPWLELRAGGWTVVRSDNAMDDFDWLRGYRGFNSWSDWSRHPNTDLVKAHQIDLAAAVDLAKVGAVSLKGLVGYRYQTFKWNAYDGFYIYSERGGFRNEVGAFGPGLGIAYQQWWHTPYLGLGTSVASGPATLTAELIGSPLVYGRDRDHHVGSTLFTEVFSPSAMVGATLAAEVALTPQVSFVARGEYQHYFEARGSTKARDLETGEVARYPKPAAGADHQSLFVSIGLKGRW
jgi:plasminogen activator